jgi:subtilisin-like proprotein convertase family protein
MIKKYPILLAFLFVILSLSVNSQESNPWSRVDVSGVSRSRIQTKVRVERYSGFALDRVLIKRDLVDVPSRRRSSTRTGKLMRFPDKEGLLIAFRVQEAPVMSPELASKFPNDKSYVGYATDGSQRKIRFSLNEVGLNAVITGPGYGVQFIEPLTRDKELYRVYDRSELGSADPFSCIVEEMSEMNKDGFQEKLFDDLQLRTYRLAVATTGEYSAYHIGLEGAGLAPEEEQRAVVMSAITTAITRVNAVLENDLAISMELIGNNDDIVYLNPATDPYSNNSGSAMLGENQENLDNVIGSNNYDIGHVFSTGGGGVATLGSACVASQKARGVTGSSNPIGESFYFDLVAHEFGHQLGANHTFNGDEGGCAGSNRNDLTAVEPGSGSTLMAYAGLCAPQNVQSQSDLYFHVISIEEIRINLSQSRDCAAMTDLVTNRNVPIADAGPDFVIPIGTPYVLRGSGSDGDDDPISYCWEQVDNEITAVPPSGNSTAGALYRSYTPVKEPNRYLPKLSTLASGSLSSTWEVTPLVAREMNFTLTIRDNNAEAGQSDSDDVLVTVTDAAGPFVVTSQDTEGLVLTPNSQEMVQWDVAGTTGNGINASSVNIRLSTDGGKTFPVFLATNVPNDGMQMIDVPDSRAPNCFIMVEAVGNFFFALNPKSFSIGEFNEVCSETPAVDLPQDIPDNDLGGIVSEIEITEDLLVERLRVHINDLEHTFLGDLDISLESPSGTVVQLLSGACNGSENIVNAIFDDSGVEIECQFNPGITGVVRPFQPLTEFNGESTRGIWKLRVVDSWEDDFGTLNDWSLEICNSEPVLAVNNFVFDQFKIFPNPSNGRFRIQFTSQITGDVDAILYDLLGRKVAERTFSSNDNAFDEEVNFGSVSSGLYILRVRRGNKISSQKITLE